MSEILQNHTLFEKARRSRDARFDGKFYVGVKTTGIYCRPVCPVRLPSPEHVEFHLTAASAEEHGYRPCFRCRPETAPGTPAWRGASGTVVRAMRLIAEGALDLGSVTDLCERLGVGERHLNRLFARYLGASPLAVAQTRRLQFARQLIDNSKMRFAEIALASGYGSVRRFNAHVRRVYAMPPSELRRRAGHQGPSQQSGLEFKLSYRPPFEWLHILTFLRSRAVAGVEHVSGSRYIRTLGTAQAPGLLVVEDTDRSCLACRLIDVDAGSLFRALEQVRLMFDLHADPRQINHDLIQGLDSDDPCRRLIVPGIRLPGCWDPFEVAVRAIVGQQISVKAATTVMARIVALYGQAIDIPACPELNRLFPAPAVLANLKTEDLPMPQKKAITIRNMAAKVVTGQLDLTAEPKVLVDQLKEIKGIGDWTAQYIVMRAGNDPDAFPAGDLVLRKTLERLYEKNMTPGEIKRLGEQWRPWRAYMLMHIWRNAS